MSTSRTVTVWCDGLDASGCTEWVHAGEESHRGVTDTQARTAVSHIGWTRAGRRDLCPECSAELALAAAEEKSDA